MMAISNIPEQQAQALHAGQTGRGGGALSILDNGKLSPPILKRRKKQRSLTRHNLWSKALVLGTSNARDDDEDDNCSRTTVHASSDFFADTSNDTFTTSSSTTTTTTTTLKSCLKRPTSASSTKPKKTVVFDSIDIYKHYMILGDNPSVTSGPPLTIAWRAHASAHVTVDDHEAGRLRSGTPKRGKQQMLVPHMVREEWLRNAGYARSQFVETEREMNKIKRERAASVAAAHRRSSGKFRLFWKALPVVR